MTVLEALPAIALDELVAQGELLTRVDRKYLLDRERAEDLIAHLGEQARVLTIDGARSFEYSSLYFDTPDLLCHRSAAHGRRRRFKVRLRTYLDSDTSFLEVKYRGRRGTTVKERRLDEGVAAEAPLRHREFLTATLERAGVPLRHADELQPVLHTRYRRSTLLVAGSRLTIDTDLGWQLDTGERADLDGTVIVETKSSGGITAADRLLRRPDRFSKYCTGLALLSPALPANRWHRALHTLQPASDSRTTS